MRFTASSVGLNSIDDEPVERVIAGIREEPTQVLPTFFARRVTPPISGKPRIGRVRVAAHGAAERLRITTDVVLESVRVREAMRVRAGNLDAVVHVTDDMGTHRTVHVLFFRVLLRANQRLELGIEAALTDFVDDIDHAAARLFLRAPRRHTWTNSRRSSHAPRSARAATPRSRNYYQNPNRQRN